MNRSTRKAHPLKTPGLWSYARRLLHAFAEAGQPSSAGLQLYLGPNGGLMWTDAAQVDRSEPYAEAVFSIPVTSQEPVDTGALVIVRKEGSTGSLVYTTLRLLCRTRCWEVARFHTFGLG
jgi:hypothetical protein